jgi:hypothetical protein
MRKRDNPYTPVAGWTPHTLAGRDVEVERFRSLLACLEAGTFERSLIYTGLAGVGKTALLTEFDAIAAESGWATTDVFEVTKGTDAEAIFARLATRLRVIVHQRLGSDIAIGHADMVDLERDLPEFVRTVGDVARDARSGALFVLDEMQKLSSESLSAICTVFQALSRSGLPVALVGAGSPELAARLLAVKPYADRLFSYVELGPLDEVAGQSALVAPAAAAGVEVAEDVARQVFTETLGFPFLLQAYGWELWNYAHGNYAQSSPITLADLDGCQSLVWDRLDRTFFDPGFHRATGSEGRYLAAMASLGQGSYRVGQVAKAFGATDQRQISMQRDALIEKDLIWVPQRGYVDFTLPLFAEFVQRSHPID